MREIVVSMVATLSVLGSGRARADDDGPPFILLIYASGGWDQTMVFDPKLGSGYAAQEPGAALATGKGDIPYVHHSKRPAVRTFFDSYGDHAAIVNGLSTGAMTRREAAPNMLAIVPPKAVRRVDWLSYYAATLTPVMKVPHLVVDAPFLAGDYAGVAIRVTTDDVKSAGDDVPGTTTFSDNAAEALTKFRGSVWSDATSAAHGSSLDGEKLRALLYGQAREKTISTVLTAARNNVGATLDSDLLYDAKIALELFAAGDAQCVTLQAGGDDAWDTTTNHWARQGALLQSLFADLLTILDYADAKGIRERILLVVASDGGRAPLLNSQGGKGRWPFTSMLLWGDMIRGGVVGTTDAGSRGMPVDPAFGGVDLEHGTTITAANVWAAIYRRTDASTKPILGPKPEPLAAIVTSGE